MKVFHDAWERWSQAAGTRAAQLVRITGHDAGNRYVARPIVFAQSGQTELHGAATLTVVNLAEPADAAGQVPAGTDALTIDAGGQWVVFIRSAAAAFPARVVSAEGGAAYLVREQACTGPGTFADATGAADLPAWNLAELSLGPGAAVDAGTIVPVFALVQPGQPSVLRYVFDHPVYAKYL